MSRVIEFRSLIENANPGIVGPLAFFRPRSATRNGHRIPAYHARQVTQGRGENSEAFAPVDVTRSSDHRLQCARTTRHARSGMRLDL